MDKELSTGNTDTQFHSAIDLLLSPDKYFAIWESDSPTVLGVPPQSRVYICVQPDVEDGQVALAMIDYDRLVLGRIARDGETVTISPPTNPLTVDTAPLIVDAHQVYILGRAVMMQSLLGRRLA